MARILKAGDSSVYEDDRQRGDYGPRLPYPRDGLRQTAAPGETMPCSNCDAGAAGAVRARPVANANKLDGSRFTNDNVKTGFVNPEVGRVR